MGVSMELNVKIAEKEKGAFTVSPIGSVDSDTYTLLEKEVDSVLSKNPKSIIFDMQAVTYISSAGLGVIFKTKKALKENNGKLYLVNLTAKVRKVFDIINALPDEEIFTSAQELDDYLDTMQRDNN
jgi:anti-sigma B factor antagonist